MTVPVVVADLLRKVAPTVAAALPLPPPFGLIAAGAVAVALKHWLPEGVDKPTPAQIAAAVQENAHDPALPKALQSAEAELKRVEAEYGFKFAELDVRDRESARAYVRDTGTAVFTQRLGLGLLAQDGMTTLAVLIGSFLLMTGRYSIGDPNVFAALMGFIGVVLGRISSRADTYVNFAFGSSAGSREKSDQLGGALKDLGDALADAPRLPAPLPLPPPPPPVVVVPHPAPLPAPGPEPDPDRPSRFISVVDNLLEHEGGYVDHPSDPGGCTNMGITIGTLRDWRGADVTCADVRALSRDEAKQIYFAKYWNAVRADELPPGVDYIVFDFAVNAGVSRASRTLQTILAKRDPSLKTDGVIGPLTIAALAKASSRDVIEEFQDARMRHYRSSENWETFGKGWTRRADEVVQVARMAARASQTA